MLSFLEERSSNVDVYTVDTLPVEGQALDRHSATSRCGFNVGQISAVQDIVCNPGTQGRYLVVQLRATQYLQLCEIEVYTGKADFHITSL